LETKNGEIMGRIMETAQLRVCKQHYEESTKGSTKYFPIQDEVPKKRIFKLSEEHNDNIFSKKNDIPGPPRWI
jgi:hypothetical protein